MKKILKKVVILMYVVMGIMIITKPVKANAMGNNGNSYQQVILNSSDKNATGGKAQSGVGDFDGATGRAESVVKGIVKAAAIIVGIISLVMFFVGLGTHQAETRNIAIIAFICAIGIYFSPEIFNYIVGR